MADKRTELLERLDNIKDLPTLPQVVLSFQEELASRYCDASSITRVIAEDPAIVAKVLKVANSPLFGVGKDITDVQQAIVRLGFYEVYNIVLTMSTINLFKNCRHIDYKRFWSHSISVGFGTGVLAKQSRKGLSEPVKASAFTAGILHDVGLLVLDINFPNIYKDIADLLAGGDFSSLWDAEEEVMGATHAEIGGVLLKKWGLPDGTISGITHQEEAAKAGEFKAVSSLVQLSNRICNDIGLDNGMSDPPHGSLRAAWAELDIPQDRLEALKTGIKEEALKSPVIVAIS